MSIILKIKLQINLILYKSKDLKVNPTKKKQKGSDLYRLKAPALWQERHAFSNNSIN